MRPGVRCFSARQPEEAAAVIEAEAAKVGAPLTMMGRDIEAFEEHGRLRVQLEDRLLDLPAPGLFGPYQFDNAGLAVAAILGLGDARIDEDALARGVAGAVWPARFQRLTAGPLAARASAAGADLWLDGGHNPHAGRALAEAVRQLVARDGRPVALICGMFARKDAEGFFRPFARLAPRVFTATFDSPNAAPADQLAAAACAAGLDAATSRGIEEALETILAAGGPAPHILVCGGLHFAGEVLAMSRETWPT
jgi:dihydrofolate synthase/folylpolyglutamate synthase